MSKLLKKMNLEEHPLGDYRTLSLPQGLHAVVDADDYDRLHHFYWRTKRKGSIFYAYRRLTHDGVEKILFLHREIMNTPPNMECHHINRNTLDNRRINLANVFPDVHRVIHTGLYAKI